MPELSLKHQDETLYYPWYDWATKKYAAYAFLLGKRDGWFGGQEAAFVRELQRRLGIVIDGVFGDRTAAAAGYKWPGATAPPVVVARRPIWVYSAPGSGAPFNVGPPFQLGERMKRDLHINHQPIGYPIGGYLGFMGGDPTYSYLEICEFLYQEWRRLLWANHDVQKAMTTRAADPHAKVDVELWGTAYSQSADAMRRAAKRLFGPGGEFELIRNRLNGFILFGDPGTPGTGISGLSYDPWLEHLVTDINYPNDFYAKAPDRIRRTMFGIIVEAEMELPFFVHVLRIAVRIVPEWLTLGSGIMGGGGGGGGLLGGILGGGGGGLLGGILGGNATGGPFGQLGQLVIGGMTGLGGNPLFGQMMGMAGSGADTEVDQKLYDLFKPSGVLNITTGIEMIQLIGALPGLQAHGGYEFDPVMMDRAFAVAADYRGQNLG